MLDAGAIEQFAELRAQQQRRAALQSSGHAWRAAAVMTCFGAPLGPLFGLTALWCLRGLGVAIDNGREAEAAMKLRVGRCLVLIGTAVAAIALLYSGFAMLSFVSDMPQQLERLRAERAVR